MKNQFIPYEQALKLKELGFDEDCLGAYQLNHNKGSLCFGGVNGFVPFYTSEIEKHNKEKWIKVISAPLWQQAFEWFREKYNLEISIIPTRILQDKCYISFIYKNSIIQEKHSTHDTYQEAQQACLEKLIEITSRDK